VEQVMGMPISVALRGRHADTTAGRSAWRAVVDQLRQVDRVFSTYRDDSIISRLGRGALTVNQCPPEVAEVLALGRAAELESGGAFSINLPAADGRRRLDPSGVVKGWATQRASQFLSALDDTDFCLSAGGDMVCRASDPDRAPWRIGIEHPHDPKSMIAVVPVRSGAVATSGTAHRGAHLVDPRSGRPPTGVASVTVIAASLTWADIDATAAYVQGPEAARWLETRPIRSALVVWADGTTERVVGPPGQPKTDATEPGDAGFSPPQSARR
jgi:thiamine biosynthesis lipoprotein